MDIIFEKCFFKPFEKPLELTLISERNAILDLIFKIEEPELLNNAKEVKQNYYCFFDKFSNDLAIKHNLKNDTSYHLAIRSMSIYDELTLNIIFDKSFTRSDLNILLSKYDL